MNQQPWVFSDNQLTIFCHIQPGAKQNQLTGLYDNCLKIQLKSPPVDGKANKALIGFLASLCSTTKSQISIKRGLTGRRKTILIQGLQEIPAKISQLSKR